MVCNVVNSVFRPDELMDLHSSIIFEGRSAANDAEQLIRQNSKVVC